jgi:hypothetical protein
VNGTVAAIDSEQFDTVGEQHFDGAREIVERRGLDVLDASMHGELGS